MNSAKAIWALLCIATLSLAAASCSPAVRYPNLDRLVTSAGGKLTETANGELRIEISGESVRQVPDFRQSSDEMWEELQRLNVPFAYSSDWGPDFRLVAKCREITGISLWHAKLNPETLPEISGLRKLRVLSIAFSRVPSADLEFLGGISSLEILNVSTSEASDATMLHLSKLPHLRWLDVGNTQITDVGMESIGTISTLKVLRLTRLPITDAGLAKLSTLQHLEELSLGATEVSFEGVRQFLKSTKVDVLYLPKALSEDPRIDDLKRENPTTEIQ